MSLIQKLATVLLTLHGFSLFAEEVMNFQTWRTQQVLEAQNQTLRIAARISQIKTGKTSSENKSAGSSSFQNSHLKTTTDSESLAVVERDLKRAQDSLQAANSLQLDDYISIYLPTLQDQPEDVKALAEKLSKEDLAEIFISLVKRGSKTSDSKRHSSAALDSLAAPSRPKSL